jgi:hypothetical protein
VYPGEAVAARQAESVFVDWERMSWRNAAEKCRYNAQAKAPGFYLSLPSLSS